MGVRAATGDARSLQELPLFSGCSRREYAHAARLGTRVQVKAGATLIEQNQPGREFLVLVDGCARCSIDGHTIADYAPGDFFGELSLLDGGARIATVVMDSPGELLVLSQGEFFELLDTSPSVMKKLLVEGARRQRATAQMLLGGQRAAPDGTEAPTLGDLGPGGAGAADLAEPQASAGVDEQVASLT
jgi:CRP/FNR family transcriptional regulator, cyclic AMP receptor protein